MAFKLGKNEKKRKRERSRKTVERKEGKGAKEMDLPRSHQGTGIFPRGAAASVHACFSSASAGLPSLYTFESEQGNKIEFSPGWCGSVD